MATPSTPCSLLFSFEWLLVLVITATEVTGKSTSFSDQDISKLGWPFLSDYRDPNMAWDLSQKVRFFLLYSAFWLCVVASVYFLSVRQTATRSPPKDAELGLLESAFGPRTPYPEGELVHELFLQRAEQAKTRTALVAPLPGKTQNISYAELQAAVQQLAADLQGLGLRPGLLAALCMERSCAQVVAILGTLASGGGFVPIDPSASRERILSLLEHSQASALLADGREDRCFEHLALLAGIPLLSARIPEAGTLSLSFCRAPQAKPMQPQIPRRPQPSDAAMLIYTSGTSGTPKGIIYDHQHLLHGAWFWAEEHSITSSSVQLLKSPYFWAVMEWEFFPVLLRGGSLVVASRDGHKNPEYMAKLIQQHCINVLMITPSVLDLLVDAHQLHPDSLLAPLEHITTVGEALPTALANRVASLPDLRASLRCAAAL